MSFNPIQDNDWQGLNIALEKLFFSKAEAVDTVQPVKKTGTISARNTVTIQNDASSEIANEEPIISPVTPIISTPVKEYAYHFPKGRDGKKPVIIKNDASSEISDGNKEDAVVKVVDDGLGASLYIDGGSQEQVTIPNDGVIYRTQAKIAIPSSYFLDLRGIYKTVATQEYTADLAVLHDVNGNTVTLASLDETNNIGVFGVGGRDQSAAFSGPVWLYFYFIYNPVTGDVSSRSSLSPTAPTLPTGYTFFVRCGSVFLPGSGNLVESYQMGDKVTFNYDLLKWDTHATGVESIDISGYVPVTAKLVHGAMGLSAGTAAKKMYVAANSGATIRVGALCDAQGTGDINYGASGSKDFTLPLLTAQTIWWATESTADIFAIGITGYTDDL